MYEITVLDGNALSGFCSQSISHTCMRLFQTNNHFRRDTIVKGGNGHPTHRLISSALHLLLALLLQALKALLLGLLGGPLAFLLSLLLSLGTVLLSLQASH